MQIKAINAADTLRLRQQILRPDGDLLGCQFPGDADCATRHFGAYLESTLIGIVSVYEQAYPELGRYGYQLRAMAVAESARGKQVGLKLLAVAEEAAFVASADYIWANARSSALGFYEKAGYQVLSDEFDIEGVGAHFLVFKKPLSGFCLSN